MNCVELINEIHHGRWETAFPDPVQEREFEEFVNEHRGERGFAIEYVMPTDEGDWSIWQNFTFHGEDKVVAEALWFPTEEAEDPTALPEELTGIAVFNYQWPEGISFTVDDDE